MVDTLCIHWKRVAETTLKCGRQAVAAVTAACHVNQVRGYAVRGYMV